MLAGAREAPEVEGVGGIGSKVAKKPLCGAMCESLVMVPVLALSGADDGPGAALICDHAGSNREEGCE